MRLTKSHADKTLIDVTHEAYLANGLQREKNGTGQSLVNSLKEKFVNYKTKILKMILKTLKNYFRLSKL